MDKLIEQFEKLGMREERGVYYYKDYVIKNSKDFMKIINNEMKYNT
jgi:hypothetical protein